MWLRQNNDGRDLQRFRLGLRHVSGSRRLARRSIRCAECSDSYCQLLVGHDGSDRRGRPVTDNNCQNIPRTESIAEPAAGNLKHGVGPAESAEDHTHRYFVEAKFLADDRRRGRDVHPIKVGDEVHQTDQYQYVPTTHASTSYLSHVAFPPLSRCPRSAECPSFFLNSARQALLLDPLDAGGITTAMPCLDFCLHLRCDGRGARRPSSF